MDWTILILGLFSFVGLSVVVIVVMASLMKSFREQMAQERTSNFDMHRQHIEMKIAQHDQVMTALVAQDRLLCKVDETTQRIEQLHRAR